MKTLKEILPKALLFLAIFTVLCGIIYTLFITGVGQFLFNNKANGSIIEVDGKKYGSELLGQQFTDNSHLWGRIMNIDTKTFKDENGKPVMYASPSNLSPASPEYDAIIKKRVEKIQKAHNSAEKIPVDLVTISGSGLDPHISVAAAQYQIDRLVINTDYSKSQIEDIINKYTTKRFLGIFGEETVNVLKVNLALDGILK